MNDTEADFLALLGYTFLQNARPDKAAVAWAALDALVPGQLKIIRGLALAQLRSGKPERALDTLDRLAMAGGMDAIFHLLRAQALTACERPVEAAAAMQTYVHLRQALMPPSQR